MHRTLIIVLVILAALDASARSLPVQSPMESHRDSAARTAEAGRGQLSASPAHASSPSNATSADPAEEVVQLINQFRLEHGRTPLVMDSRLADAALRHSLDMATNDFFDHIGSDGSDPWQRMREAGYPLDWGAECIAAGQQDAQSVLEAWLSSPRHQDILLGGFVHVGAGLAENPASTYGFYWTLNLAVPLPATVFPTSTPAWSPTPVATSTATPVTTATPRPVTPTGTSTPRPVTPTGTVLVQVSPTYTPTPTSTPRPVTPTATPETGWPSPTVTPIAYPGPGTPWPTILMPTRTATPIGYISPTPPVTGVGANRVYLPLLNQGSWVLDPGS